MTLKIPPLPAEVLFHILGFSITNTIINTWIAMVIFLCLGIAIKRHISMKPGKLQNASEFFLEQILGYFDQVTGNREKTIRFLPIVGSIFFFVLLSNWLGIIPGTGNLTYHHEFVLRSANSDLNLTLAMALVSVILSHVYAFMSIGVFTHLGKFVQIKKVFLSLKKGPIAVISAIVEFFVGLLEIISEVAKVISLSLRLFGNVFAGEVLMMVLSSLIALLVPTPFMLLELFVGIIQAAVFAMLTLVYMSTAVEIPHGSRKH